MLKMLVSRADIFTPSCPPQRFWLGQGDLRFERPTTDLGVTRGRRHLAALERKPNRSNGTVSLNYDDNRGCCRT